jgi:hypothetical protein
MRWAGHVACIGERRGAYRVLLVKPLRKRPLGRLGVDGRIVLKLFLNKSFGRAWTGLIWPRIGAGDGLLLTC